MLTSQQGLVIWSLMFYVYFRWLINVFVQDMSFNEKDDPVEQFIVHYSIKLQDYMKPIQ